MLREWNDPRTHSVAVEQEEILIEYRRPFEVPAATATEHKDGKATARWVRTVDGASANRAVDRQAHLLTGDEPAPLTASAFLCSLGVKC